jgi:LacI family transcriptional regulator
MNPKRASRQVALALPAGLTFIERILKSVLDYGLADWSFIRMPERIDPSLEWLRDSEADGALVMVSSERDAEIARNLPMPVVNLSGYFQNTDLPTVMVDHAEIAKTAARHLLERNYSRFAYFGTSDTWYSRVRRKFFVETIEAAGGDCKILEVPGIAQKNGDGWRNQRERLEAFLRTLDTPVAMMASTDLRAFIAAQACARLGLRVPEDVALIGVDNDPSSEFHNPPISSVSRNDAGVGLQAAALLDHLMRGGSPPAGPILVPPGVVVRRHSTEETTISRSRIARAVAFIHRNVHRPIAMEELLELASMPQAIFETRFVKTVGIMPSSFIDRCRVERAASLLVSAPKSSLKQVALQSGFCSPRQFRQVFQRLQGMPPSRFLSQHQARSRRRGSAISRDMPHALPLHQ